MITLIPAPAATTAKALKLPMSPATVEGSPKTPLPMMEFTTSANRLQRPITRTSPSRGGLLAGYSIRAFVSQNEDARTTVKTELTELGDLGTIVDCTIGCDRASAPQRATYNPATP